jgi:hypothetical protein
MSMVGALYPHMNNAFATSPFPWHKNQSDSTIGHFGGFFNFDDVSRLLVVCRTHGFGTYRECCDLRGDNKHNMMLSGRHST